MSEGASSLPPEVIAELTASVKETLATIIIGFTLATTLYGITVLQTYLYYKTYSKDPIWFKLFVAALWALDTFTTILVAHSIYTYVVLNFGDLEADTKIAWSFALESEIVDIITLFAQCYFAFQLFKLSPSKIMPTVIVLLSIAAFCLDIRVTTQLFASLSVEVLSERSVFVVGSIVQGLCALCDILITFSLIYTLRNWKSGIASRTAAIVDGLILYTITRGIATTICQIMFMALNVALPDHTYWQPFHQMVGKLYVNSVLASLNFRAAPAKSGSGAIPLGKGHASTSGTQFQVASNSFALSSNPLASTVANFAPSKYQSSTILAPEERQFDNYKREDSVA